jgi:heme/copper-type cytochrome/quinol oxidase subunit 3
MPSLTERAPEWAPEVDGHLARVGMWIWIGADVLYFAAWYFAFFYLRALNNNHEFKPTGIFHPTRYAGGIIVLLVIATAALYWIGARSIANRAANGRALLWLALAAGILCIGFQIYEFGHLGFNPQLGRGYPSVFIGLKGAWLVQLVGAVLWLASHIAQSRPGGDVTIRPASAVTFGYFLAFLAAIGVISFLLLYIVV